jgi:hypothetical protein
MHIILRPDTLQMILFGNKLGSVIIKFILKPRSRCRITPVLLRGSLFSIDFIIKIGTRIKEKMLAYGMYEILERIILCGRN